MFNGKFGLPELSFIAIMLLLVGMIAAAVWLTRKSKQSNTGKISRASIALIALGFTWCCLITAGMWQSPLFGSSTFIGALVFSVPPLLLALGVFLLGKRKRDWNVSARWFFWSMFVLSFLLSATHKR